MASQIIEAAHCGIAVLGLAMITNRCKGPDDDFPAPTHTEVLDSVKASAAYVPLLSPRVCS
jgi:purine nucleoside phosphorylase